LLRTAPRPPDSPAPAPPPYRRSHGPFIALVLLLIVGAGVVVFLVVAGGEESLPNVPVTSPSAPTASGPSTTLDPEAATKAEIEAAYRQASDAFVAVASDPNATVEDPRLDEHLKGTALAAAKLSVRKLRADGDVLQVTRLELNPRVVELGPDSAVVEDCAVDVSAIVDRDTGEVVVPAGPPEPKLMVATYERVDRVWMQDSFKDTQQSCVPAQS
jgi:hypothetical protein